MKKLKRVFIVYILKIFLYAIILSSFLLFYYIPCLHELTKCITGDIENDLVVGLLPMIVSIVTISLSLSNETINGINRREFNILKNKTIFSFYLIEYIVLTILSFGLYILFFYYKEVLMMVILNIWVILISIIFVIQEILILIKNERFINYILKRYYLRNDVDPINFSSQANYSNFHKMINYSLLNYGYESTYKTLKRKFKKYDKELLLYLITINAEFFENYEISLDSIKSLKEFNEVNNSNIVNEINNALSNIKYIVVDSDILDYMEKEKEIGFSVTIGDILIALLNISDKLNLNDFLNEKIYKLFKYIINEEWVDKERNIKRDDKLYLYKILIYPLAKSLMIDDNFSFLYLIRDFAPGIHLVNKSTLFYYYLLIFLSYLHLIDINKKEKIEDFIKDSNVGFYKKDESLKEKFKDLFLLNKDKAVSLLPELLNVYDLYGDDFYSYLIDNSYKIPGYIPFEFSKNFIIDFYLEVLTIKSIIPINFNLDEIVNNLNEKDVYTFKECLKNHGDVITFNYEIKESLINSLGFDFKFDFDLININNKNAIHKLLK